MKKEHTNQHGINNEQKAQMLMSGWNSQMNAIWHIHQHIFIAQGAVLAAWFYLYDKEHPALGIGLMLLINTLFLIGIFIVKRHYQIQNKMNDELHSLGVLSKPEKAAPLLGGFLPNFFGSMNNHQLARLIIALLIIVNNALSIVSIHQMKLGCNLSSLAGSVMLLINLSIVIKLLCRWQELIKSNGH